MSHQLTARNVKFMLDGVIESHTAAMLELYSIYRLTKLHPRAHSLAPLSIR